MQFNVKFVFFLLYLMRNRRKRTTLKVTTNPAKLKYMWTKSLMMVRTSMTIITSSKLKVQVYFFKYSFSQFFSVLVLLL